MANLLKLTELGSPEEDLHLLIRIEIVDLKTKTRFPIEKIFLNPPSAFDRPVELLAAILSETEEYIEVLVPTPEDLEFESAIDRAEDIPPLAFSLRSAILTKDLIYSREGINAEEATDFESRVVMPNFNFRFRS